MIAQGTQPKDVTPEQIDQVANDLELFCKANKITRKQVAKALGYSQGVISEFIKGTYKGDRGQVALDVEDWLVEEEQRRANQQATRFVWTNVATQIRSVASYCLDMRKVGMVYGPETTGIGKTTSMLAIHQDLGPRRSTLVTVDKADANPTGLLKKILNAMRMNESGSNAQRMERIVTALKGRSHLLMIDQLHNLRFAKEDRPLYYLMDIYEATDTAQLWCCTSDMVEYLQRRQYKTLDEPLAQIRSRIFPCVDLMEMVDRDGGGEPLFTVDQIREMFASYQLKLSTPAARFLCALAHQKDSGGLRICVQIMEYACYIGKLNNVREISVKLLKDAMAHGITTDRASRIIVDVEQPPTAKAKTA